MTEILTHPLPYKAESTDLFELVKHMPWAQLLDSGNVGGLRGRYDIISADPYLKITMQQGLSKLSNRAGKIIDEDEDPFQLLKKTLLPFHGQSPDIPFCGGAIGYFGYDLLNDSRQTDDRQSCISGIPDMAIGIYDWAIITDHELAKTYLVSAGKDALTRETVNRLLDSANFQALPAIAPTPAPLAIDQLETDIDQEAYQDGFAQIQKYLLEGDCYQINYARCFFANTSGSTWESYKQLRKSNPVPFGAYLNYPFAEILCASPERFIRVTGNRVETRPIKGTRPRSSNTTEDAKLKNDLLQSEKDQAENLMIVDLLRNDLGKSCQPGTIHVPELFQVESYPTVFHLVSSIKGTVAPDKSALDVLQDCFPGGSITGAPKKRAMEIIRELEKHQRGVYCGAIGYISFNGNMDTNIAIRTMTVSQERLAFWAGGGIVSDSDVDAEFQETQDKARAFFKLLSVNEV